MVGVVAADLGATRCAVQGSLGVGTKGILQPLQQGAVTCCLCCSLGSGAAVKVGESAGVDAVGKLLLPDRNVFHHGKSLLLKMVGMVVDRAVHPQEDPPPLLISII